MNRPLPILTKNAGRPAFLLLLGFLIFGLSANCQTTLTPGDIAIIGFDITAPQFAFVTLTDISPGTIINFTDKGWTGSAFNSLTSEGVLTWTTSAAVPAGTVVKVLYNGVTNPTVSGFPNGSVSVSGWTATSIYTTNGDQAIVYQGSAASPSFIYGFSCSTANGSPSTTLDWQTGTITSNRDSQLPTGLTNSTNSNVATAMAFLGQNVNHDYAYNAKTFGFSGDKSQILSLIANRANWNQAATTLDLSPNGANFPTAFVLPSALPVTWLSFDVKQQENLYDWDWTLATEENVAYYVPQYSTDGITFADAGKVTPFDNSKTYQFSAALKLTGNTLFRVQEVDLDGKATYSSIRSLESASSNKTLFYPNPAKDAVWLQWPYPDARSITTVIVDDKGAVVHQQRDGLTLPLKITLSGLAPGLYFVNCTDDKQHRLTAQPLLKVAD
jgi:hypothetical protein